MIRFFHDRDNAGFNAGFAPCLMSGQTRVISGMCRVCWVLVVTNSFWKK